MGFGAVRLRHRRCLGNDQFPVHIAVNTTVGTGSETSNLIVITDTTSPNAPHK